MDTITDGTQGEDSDAFEGGIPFQRDPPAWLHKHARWLILSDALSAANATLLARIWAYGWGPAELQIRSLQIPYTAAVAVTIPIWLVVLATSRCYDLGPLGSPRNETRRVVSAGAHFLATIAVAYYIVNLERLGRDFLIAIVPLAVVLTLLGRTVIDHRLRRQRDRGRCLSRAIVMGSRRNATALVNHLARHPRAGVDTVAILTTDGEQDHLLGTRVIPVTGGTDNVIHALKTIDADLLLITDGLAPGQLRRLTWRLEGTGVAVFVAPAAAQLAEPDLDVRPVAGLPLLYVDGNRSASKSQPTPMNVADQQTPDPTKRTDG